MVMNNHILILRRLLTSLLVMIESKLCYKKNAHVSKKTKESLRDFLLNAKVFLHKFLYFINCLKSTISFFCKTLKYSSILNVSMPGIDKIDALKVL